jgi:hypothetical protein
MNKPGIAPWFFYVQNCGKNRPKMAFFGYSLPLGLSLILKNPPEKVIVRWKEEE